MRPDALSSSLALLAPLALAARPRDAILLSQVKTLTLSGNGAMTTHRRVPAIPQLRCISHPDICNLYRIHVMRCSNQGSSYGDQDIEWSCTASLPEELKLGSTDVVCEGYARPDDDYVLKGSCGVEYRLVLTSKGETRYPDIAQSRRRGTDWSAWLFGAVFLAVLACIVGSACFGNNGQRPARRWGGGWGGWGGGGGGGGWHPGWGPGDDPPPPYPGPKPYPSQQRGWSPGFWSGLAGGAAAGYMAGSRGSRSRNDGRQRDSYAGRDWGAGPSRSFSASSGDSSSHHESTGFGSTRRR